MPILTPTAMADDAESRLSTRHRGARVLLAEDHAINVEVVIEILHAVGIDVAVAVNGREAVERACYQTFDLILMDIQMPEMGGIEATRLIRGLPQWADRPIIAPDRQSLCRRSSGLSGRRHERYPDQAGRAQPALFDSAALARPDGTS
jgi:DNA-binding NarL/FixJ family response regulator